MIGGRSFVSPLHSTSPYMLRCARGETKLCNKESDGTRGVVDMFFPTVSFQMRYTCCAHWHACDVRVNNDQVALCNEGKAALCNEEREGDGTRGVVAGRIGALLLLSIPALPSAYPPPESRWKKSYDKADFVHSEGRFPRKQCF